MATVHLLLLLYLLLPTTITIFIPPWPSPYWSIPGSYCQSSYPERQCCPGRRDRCGVPILGTVCYCDTFCNRTGSSDCCPDYFTHCEGLYEGQYEEQKAPAALHLLGPPTECQHGVLNISNPMCSYGDTQYTERDTIHDNCNTCRCQVSSSQPGCMEVLCSTHKCLVEERVLSELTQGAAQSLYTWTPANYTQFWGKSLQEGIKGKLGAKKPELLETLRTPHMTAVHLSYPASILPHTFDSVTAWPGLTSPVTDQGWCASSWLVSAVGVAGDRTSIGQGEQVVLSTEALPCYKGGSNMCEGGYVDQAWNLLRRHGSWNSSCQTHSITSCPSHCKMHRTQPAYRVGRGDTANNPDRNEKDIMYEVMTQGPVQAIMEVYTDFFVYGGGVYKKTNLGSSNLAGYHAVRIVGWGQEGSVKYWKVANSWGTEWGEKGFFRIARGSNECRLEDFVLGVWPRKKRSPRMRKIRNLDRKYYSSSGIGRRHTRHGRRPKREMGERKIQGNKEKYHQIG